MSSFSKQFIENSNLDLTWDFDLEEVFKTLEKGYYQPMICEGIGFTAAGVDNEGNRMVFIRDFENKDGGEWIEYEKLFNR